jgi:hypothetical protein
MVSWCSGGPMVVSWSRGGFTLLLSWSPTLPLINMFILISFNISVVAVL